MDGARSSVEALGAEVLAVHHYTAARGGERDDHVTISVRIPRASPEFRPGNSGPEFRPGNSGPEFPDYYGEAAEAAGLLRADVINHRGVRNLAARWGVWEALSDAGWSNSAIAHRSTPARKWDASTVRSALGRGGLPGGSPAELCFSEAWARVTRLLRRDSHATVTVMSGAVPIGSHACEASP